MFKGPFLLCLGLLAVLGFAFASTSGPATVDRSWVLEQLAAKVASTPAATIHYEQFRFTTTADAWQQLKNILVSGEAAADENLLHGVRSWLRGVHPFPLEAWNGVLAYGGERWHLQRERKGEDTTGLALGEPPPGASKPALTRSERVHVGTADQIRIVDNRVVIRSAPRPQWPLLELDLSLGPWEEALHSPQLPTQRIDAYRHDNLTTLRYSNTRLDGGQSTAEYVFDSARSWAPVAFSIAVNGNIAEERFFAYSGSSHRPTITVQARYRAEGHVHVALHLINSWHDVLEPGALVPRLPPMRFEISETSEGRAAQFVLPPFMDDVEPGNRLPTAIAEILNDWATTNSNADFNTDRIVDLKDVFHVIDEMPR